MPSKEDFVELLNNCNWSWMQLDSIYGYKIQSKKAGNTNSIFLPAAGYVDNGVLDSVNYYGDYWSTSRNDNKDAYGLDFSEDEIEPLFYGSKSAGFNIRPIKLS